jgi:uncharacterized metal-binding protein YceD (DUF177 family)
MTERDPQSAVLRVADLNERRPTRFDLTFGPHHIEQLVRDLDLIALKKPRFQGELRAEGKSEWVLQAKLGATVQQPCVVTLDPVTTRIDDTITRRFIPADRISGDVDDDGEIEINDDDTLEPLDQVFDLHRIFTEALALALPDYPRSTDDPAAPQVFAQDGVAPMTDDDAKPFAALAALKSKMEKDT